MGLPVSPVFISPLVGDSRRVCDCCFAWLRRRRRFVHQTLHFHVPAASLIKLWHQNSCKFVHNVTVSAIIAWLVPALSTSRAENASRTAQCSMLCCGHIYEAHKCKTIIYINLLLHISWAISWKLAAKLASRIKRTPVVCAHSSCERKACHKRQMRKLNSHSGPVLQTAG